jgi:predicted O-methyltransferase YrrM
MQTENASNTMKFPWCPQLNTLYSIPIIVGQSGRKFENTGSLSTINNIELLRAIMLDVRPNKTLEVGLAFGGSALTIAACHRELGHSDPGCHTAIDLAQGSYWDNAAVGALQRAGLSRLVRTIEQPSATALASLHASGERYDLCYIDGSHQFEDVFVDFYFVGRMMMPRGVVLFDDSADAHVAKVLRFIRLNYKDAFDETDLSPYMADSRQKLRRRLGRVIGRVQLTGFSKKRDLNASLQFRNF